LTQPSWLLSPLPGSYDPPVDVANNAHDILKVVINDAAAYRLFLSHRAKEAEELLDHLQTVSMFCPHSVSGSSHSEQE
jgi:hypothetical protein